MIMKTNITLSLLMLFGMFTLNAQQNEACMEKLSIFSEAVKVKNYDAAFEPWMYVRENCPKLHKATYAYGAKILENKIKKSEGGEKIKWVNDLINLHKESLQHMPSKHKIGKTEAKIGQLMFDQKLGVPADQFVVFDKAFKTDSKSFQNPKSIYTYFKLVVGMFDKGEKDFQFLVDMYTTVTDKIELENKFLSGKIDALLIKEEAGTISTKESKKLKFYNSYLFNYAKISGGVDKELGDRAGCDKLVPLFEKNFEANKDNIAWLKGAASRLNGKDCADAPIFKKLVETFHSLDPSAASAKYLAKLSLNKKDYAGAEKYYNESANLYTDGFDKAKVYYVLAVLNKKRGRKGAARTYANKTLAAQPSFGKAYLLIAGMYASSANSCGTTTFDKRATFWLAANVAEKAGRVNGSLKKAAAQTAANYRAKAPSKQDIFTSGKSGQTLNIGCWINKTVKVPAL